MDHFCVPRNYGARTGFKDWIGMNALRRTEEQFRIHDQTTDRCHFGTIQTHIRVVSLANSLKFEVQQELVFTPHLRLASTVSTSLQARESMTMPAHCHVILRMAGTRTCTHAPRLVDVKPIEGAKVLCARLRAHSQVDDHKEVWLLDRHQREWCPGPDPAPLPPPGMFQLCVPRLALTWPQQAPQQQQQSVQWRAA
eukprot:1133586-Pelagomonas_calceolata.AAC.1